MQTALMFDSDVRLSPVIYRDAQNWKQKLCANSNDNNFLLGSQIESRNIFETLVIENEARSKCKTQ